MGALVLKNPDNPLASFALSSVDNAITIYTSAVYHRNSLRMSKNLRWLNNLRSKIGMRMMQHRSPETAASGTGGSEDTHEGYDVELLGWKTRLIQRAGKSLQTASTISSRGRQAAERGLRQSVSLDRRGDTGQTNTRIEGMARDGQQSAVDDEFARAQPAVTSAMETGVGSNSLHAGNTSDFGTSDQFGGMLNRGVPVQSEGSMGANSRSITSEALVSYYSVIRPTLIVGLGMVQTAHIQLNQFWDPSILQYGTTDRGAMAVGHGPALGYPRSDRLTLSP
jgi:hypothetical protein